MSSSCEAQVIRSNGSGRRRALPLAGFIQGLVAAALLFPQALQAQQPASPFPPGENLVYHVQMGRLASGRGEMRVHGPEQDAGREIYLLSFEVRGGFGPFRMEGVTRSWVDAGTHSAVRFHKRERSPLGTNSRTVELDAQAGTWRAVDGESGTMPTANPLDELSFLYYLRQLPLVDGARYGLTRHFEEARNPVVISVEGRRRIEVPAGAFDVILIDMRVPDEKLDNGSVIRLYVTDDERRIPVRIESSVKHVGRVVLTLESRTVDSGRRIANATGEKDRT